MHTAVGPPDDLAVKRLRMCLMAWSCDKLHSTHTDQVKSALCPHFRLVVRRSGPPSPPLLDWNPPLAARHVAARQWTRSTVDSPSPAYQPLSWAQMARRMRLLSFPRRMRNAEGPRARQLLPCIPWSRDHHHQSVGNVLSTDIWLPDAWIPNPLGAKYSSGVHGLHRSPVAPSLRKHRRHRLNMPPQ
jgi:hypothetical protein